jgi:hypothetical protein
MHVYNINNKKELNELRFKDNILYCDFLVFFKILGNNFSIYSIKHGFKYGGTSIEVNGHFIDLNTFKTKSEVGCFGSEMFPFILDRNIKDKSIILTCSVKEKNKLFSFFETINKDNFLYNISSLLFDGNFLKNCVNA